MTVGREYSSLFSSKQVFDGLSAGKRLSTKEHKRYCQKYGLLVRDYRPVGPYLLSVKVGTDLSDEELLEKAQAIDEVRVRNARNDINAFIEYCFTDKHGDPLRQGWLHVEMQDAITMCSRVIIVEPRNHGKSTQLAARIIWELGRNPNIRMKVICSSDSKARDRLYEVKEHIDKNDKVRRVFPHLSRLPGSDGEWSKHKIIVERSVISKDASVEAVGVGSSITGGRCDILFADDIVDRRNALGQPKLREAVKVAWYSDLINFVDPDGKIVYVCTLWHKGDLSHDLLKNEQYTIVFRAVGPGLDALWPEKWGYNELMERKKELRTTEFNRGYRNIASADTDEIIKWDWISDRFFNLDDLDTQGLAIVTSYDLSTGKKDGDFFASTIFAVDAAERVVYVIDAWRDRIRFTQQHRAIIRESRKHDPEAVLIETIAYQESLKNYLDEKAQWIPVVGVKPSISKRMRLERVSPYLEDGTVWFSDHLHPDNCDGMRDNLVDELIDFLVAEFDDQGDSFSQGMRFIANEYLDNDEYNDSGSASIRTIGG